MASVRSWLYIVARLLGDVHAVRRGPDAMVKRVMLRLAGKVTGRMLGRLFR